MYNVKSFKNERKKTKYRNSFTDYNGSRYHSKFEAKVAQDLDFMKKSGEVEEWERQVRIDLRVDGEHVCNYYIDFIVYHKSGVKEYIEVKGFETDVWRIKWRLFELQIKREEPDAILTVMKK